MILDNIMVNEYAEYKIKLQKMHIYTHMVHIYIYQISIIYVLY